MPISEKVISELALFSISVFSCNFIGVVVSNIFTFEKNISGVLPFFSSKEKLSIFLLFVASYKQKDAPTVEVTPDILPHRVIS